MSLLTRSERLALLVSLLGEDAANVAREGLANDAKAEFEDAIADFEAYPPSSDEIDIVLDDFKSYFEMAVESAEKNPLNPEEATGEREGLSILQIPEESFAVEMEPTKKFEAPDLTGETIVDLNRLHPYQVAQALRNEEADIITLVVRNLVDEHAAKTLEFLPDALRGKVFLQLAVPSSTKPVIENIVLNKALEAALKVEQRDEEPDSSERMSKVMRSLPRTVRGPMMAELTKSNPELAEAVKNKLYLFEDLLSLEKADIQKLLGQCRTDVLVVALQNVDEELLNHVLGNMSKRAKESLLEEMEFKANAKQAEIDDGRKQVVKVLMELVESGAVSMD